MAQQQKTQAELGIVQREQDDALAEQEEGLCLVLKILAATVL